MPFFIPGRMMVLTLVLIAFGSMLVLMRLGKGRKFTIRKPPGVGAIGEAVNRAVELGRPILMAVRGSLYSTKYAADTAAGLAVAGYATKNFIAPSKAQLIVATDNQEVLPVVDNIVRQGLAAGGAPELYKPGETIRFVATSQMAYAAAYVGILYREKVASTILITMFAGEVGMLCEEGSRVGAFQVAGSTNVYQIPLMICMVDYMLFGEDMLAAMAWISEDPGQVTTIMANDVIRLIAIGAILIGSVLVTLGNTALRTFWGSF